VMALADRPLTGAAQRPVVAPEHPSVRDRAAGER
jgi:hypothetical protein